jgi:hypothetical protein
LSIGFISALKRFEEGATPSRPLLFILTSEPSTAELLIPAINVFVCVPFVPTRIVPESPLAPAFPISILSKVRENYGNTQEIENEQTRANRTEEIKTLRPAESQGPI